MGKTRACKSAKSLKVSFVTLTRVMRVELVIAGTITRLNRMSLSVLVPKRWKYSRIGNDHYIHAILNSREREALLKPGTDWFHVIMQSSWSSLSFCALCVASTQDTVLYSSRKPLDACFAEIISLGDMYWQGPHTTFYQSISIYMKQIET